MLVWLITISDKNQEIDPGAHKLHDASWVWIQEGVELEKVTWNPLEFLWDAGKQGKKNNCFNIQKNLAKVSFSNREFTKMRLVGNRGSKAQMILVCKLIGESCVQLTCLKIANPFSRLSALKSSWLVNGYNKEAKMVLVRVATRIQNRMNIVCGPARMQI